jgi:Histidine kinase-, DNA gyrase B-, and HSP90-like ATPase
MIDPNERLPSDEIREEDLSESNPLRIDQAGAHRHFRSLHSNDAEYIKEVIQNAIDSRDEGENNVIEIFESDQDPFLTVIDHGDGITKDYDGDIMKFLDAMKTTSNKNKRKAIGKKGIGMFDYTNIGDRIIITSMDKYMVYRLPLYIDQNGFTSIGRTAIKPINDEFKKEFGIFHSGTKVAFHKRSKDTEAIDLKTIGKMVRDSYTLLMARNPHLNIIIQNKNIELPNWIKEHPERHIANLKGGYPISGAIWKDERGEGEIKIFVDGHFIETIAFDNRQAIGYVNCDMLVANEARTAIIRNNEQYKEFKQKILTQISKFPRSGEPIKNTSKDTKDLIGDALRDVIPKFAVHNNGNAHTEESIGDPITIKKSRNGIDTDVRKPVVNPRGPSGPRIPAGIPDTEKQRKIRTEGTKKGRDKDLVDVIETDKRESCESFAIPYLDRSPILVEININNSEYVPYAHAKTKKTKLDILAPSLAEIRLVFKMQTDKEIVNADFNKMRELLSYERAHVLKSTGMYPEVVQKIRNKNSRDRVWK